MSKAKILIVEDENLVARDIQNMVLNLGYSVVACVAKGKEAVRAAAEKKPDLILMDIVLKGEMDGIQAADMIQQSQGIPVIYLTAYFEEPMLERAKKTYPHGYLLKPFEQQALNTAIELALYKHGEEAKLQASERWFSSILNHFGKAVFACSAKGRIAFMNPMAETLTGWTQADALGKPCQKVIHLRRLDTGRPLSLPYKKLLLKGEWEAPIRCRLPDKSGSESIVEIQAAHVKDEKTAAAHLVFTLRRIAPSLKDEKKPAFSVLRDPLTGLLSRFLFEDRLDMEIARASRKGLHVAVVVFAMAGRKEAKTRFRGDMEDGRLKKAAARITRILRAGDSIARFRGNAFIVSLADISCPEMAVEIAKRVQSGLKKAFSSGGRRIRLKPKCGLAVYPNDGQTPMSLIQKAEAALRRARKDIPSLSRASGRLQPKQNRRKKG